jgi:MFS family permease
MWLGTLLCFGSFVANVVSVIVDKHEGDKANLEETTSDEDISLQEAFRMPRLFWCLTGLCVILYCAILPFNNIASAFFVETTFTNMPLAVAQQRAGNVMSIMFLVSALGTPPFGALVDFVGLRGHFLLASAVLVTITYGAMFVLPAALSMLCLGIVYTVFAGALWPTFALTVPQKQLGTAYGIATAMQNGGLAVVPLVVGHLQATPSSDPGNFRTVMRLFMFFGLAGCCLALEILRENSAVKGSLSLPSKMIEALDSAKSKKEVVNEKTKLVQ